MRSKTKDKDKMSTLSCQVLLVTNPLAITKEIGKLLTMEIHKYLQFPAYAIQPDITSEDISI